MLPSVIQAYEAEGFQVRLGSPRLRTAGVHPIGRFRYAPSFEHLTVNDWGFTIRDFYLFRLIGREMKPRTALVIGNAYGMSAVSLAEGLKPISVDVIDAEVLDDDSRIGADLTRRVAKRLGLDLRVTAGFSPQDLDAACRHEAYEFVFIDGDHTNEQIVKDFEGVLPRLAERCAIVFHDVGNLNMDEGWAEVKRCAEGTGLRAFDLPFTDFGDTILLRGAPSLEAMFEATTYGLREFKEVYRAGFGWTYPGQSPSGEVLLIPHDARLAFYGAGNDLEHYRAFIERHPQHVAAILDDDSKKWGSRRFGVEVVDPARLPSLDVFAVIGATRTADLKVRASVARLAPHLSVHPRGWFNLPVEIHVQEPPRMRSAPAVVGRAAASAAPAMA